MKIGDLASILNKDATELVKAYNLTENDDGIELEQLKNIIGSEIQAIEKSSLKRGKDDGYGMAERLVKTEVEKRLKTEFGIDGANLDEIVTDISGLIKQKKEVKKTDDAELQREIDLRKKTEAEFEEFKLSIEKEKKRSNEFSIFDSHFSKHFKTSTDWIKSSAFERFNSKYEIMRGNDSTFAIDKNSGKPISDNLDDVITSFFKDDFETIESKKPAQPSTVEPVSISGSKEELFSQLRGEKDPARREAILKKLKEL